MNRVHRLILQYASLYAIDGFITAVSALVLLRTGASAMELSIAVCLITIPRIVVGPFFGVIVDKVDRKRCMFFSTLALFSGLLFAALSISNIFSLPVVIAIWLLNLLTAVSVSMSTLASRVLLRNYSTLENLAKNNGMIQAVTWPSYFAGAGLVGLVGDFNVAFWIVTAFTALMFLAIGFFFEDAKGDSSKNQSLHFFSDIAEGYRELKTHQSLHVRMKYYPIFTFYWRGMINILLPLVVVQQLNLPNSYYGTLLFVNGAFELLANIVVGRISWLSHFKSSFWSEALLLCGLSITCLVVFFQFPPEWLYASVAIVGIAAAFADIPFATEMQLKISGPNQGKVFSFWYAWGGLGGGIGTLVVGASVDVLGMKMALMCLVGLLIPAALYILSYGLRRASMTKKQGEFFEHS
ncbi:MFS transporter [Pseudomonas sp. FP1742]|uniref:MFS transporter n=1 Tax=Pseudomonas sp. FP1742 TaxID=2954079 RepID=UPI0027374C9F|nr:MFS transporter [Pseudomonas sp. FP1742]WLG48871.1 MFS transporter [Pseudomonas sp. FP1742]